MIKKSADEESIPDGMRKTVPFFISVLFVFITTAFSLSFATSSHAITITGAETITTNSSASYSAAGCSGTVTWNVTGTGASISSNGVLTTGPASCGGITVTARCSDGSIATKTARVTNAGQWVLIEIITYGTYAGATAQLCICISGKQKDLYYGGCCSSTGTCDANGYTGWLQYTYLCSGSGAQDVCTGCCSPDPKYGCIRYKYVYEWQCPSCTNGQIIPCYSGPAGTDKVGGECKAGTQTCVNGQWGACTGEVLPQAEICGNNTDENCDGNINEGCETCNNDKCGNTCNSTKVGSTANFTSGNLYHDQTLFQTSTLGITLSYNSIDNYTGPLGKGWTHNWNMLLFSAPSSASGGSANSIGLKQGDGNVVYFRNSNGIYYPDASSGEDSYITYTSDTYTLIEKNGTTYNFKASTGRLTSIKDRNGNTTTLSYNGNDLSGITDASGRTIYITTGNGKITSITTPDNRVYRLTYTGDHLTSVADPEMNTWQYTYNQNGMMLTKTDPKGYITTYTYDTNNKVISSQDPEGKTKAITYDPINQTAQATEKDGGIWTYKYDPLLNVTTQKTDPLGNVTTYTYDTNKNLTSTKEPDGSTTTYTYDTNRNMTSVTDPLGNTTAYTYNQSGQITSVTDSQNKVTAYAYDAKGNLLSVTDPTGAITQYQYDSKGNVISITNANSQTTTLAYDQFNNLASVTDPTGSTTTFAYDVAGNMTSQTDSHGNTTRFEYNSLNQLIKITDPQNNITTYTYDKNGNRTSETDANGKTTYYEYNYKGQLTKVTDSLGNVTTYTYGGTGCSSCGGGTDKLTAITDAKGNTTTYQYDTTGRLIKETDSLGNVIIYTYDAKGSLTSKKDSKENATAYTYDSLGRLTKKTYPDGSSEVFEYSAKGEITSAGNKDIAYRLSYDSKGRLTASTDSNNRTVSYEYDAVGNRTKMTMPDGKVIIYKYDSNNRLIELTSDAGTFYFTYDSLGRRIRLSLPNGTYATYNYDSAGRLTNLTHKTSSGSVINSFAYTHDKVGNRLSKLSPEQTIAYQYDGIYRLIEALSSAPGYSSNTTSKGKGITNATQQQKEYFTYDPVGNRLTSDHNRVYTYNEGNQLISENGVSYAYDKNGNLIGKTDTSGLTTYSYDYENRLIKVVMPNGTVSEFKYDPFGRRIEKKVTDSGITITKKYFYDSEDILFEYDENGVIGNRYIHGLGIDEPLALINKQGTFYYHADGLGSIVALTDSSQKIVQTYEYDSFGNLKDQKERIKQPYTFTGREWDGEIKAYHLRNRTLDPVSGRFTTKDPIGFSGGDINLYRYAKSNPILYTDPFGLTVKLCKRDLNIPLPNSQFFLGEDYHHAFLWINGKTFGLTTHNQRITKRCGIEGPGVIESDYQLDIDAARSGKMHGSCQEVKCENEDNLLKHMADKAPYYCLAYRNFYNLPPTGTIGMNCQEWAEMMIGTYCKCGK